MNTINEVKMKHWLENLPDAYPMKDEARKQIALIKEIKSLAEKTKQFKKEYWKNEKEINETVKKEWKFSEIEEAKKCDNVPVWTYNLK